MAASPPASDDKDMLSDQQIGAARLQHWRKLGQGLHARFLTPDFASGARFVTSIGQTGDLIGHHPQVRMDSGFVDLKLITDDAIYRDEEGNRHVVEWVTRQDIELAQQISAVADRQGLVSEPRGIAAIELALDTAHSAAVAPVWSVLLTGGPEAQGRGTIGDDIRDPGWRVPILWFQQTDEHPTPRQRFHLDIQLPFEVAEERIAAAVRAGGVVVDDSRAPWTTILADPDGNKVCIGTSGPPDA